MSLTLIFFWAAAIVVVYTYLLFPLIIFVRGLWLRKPYRTADITPRVSLLIAAHNEAETIGAKLDNILALDYPMEHLDVIIASDGSDDGTNAVVQRYAEHGVRLLPLPRLGKAPALNAAAAAASGEILAFSDANSMFAPDAIRALVRPFADPQVGGVAGNQRYLRKESGGGETSYWRFDRKLKQSQSRAGNAISATGAIYAIRRALFEPIPGGVTDDFFTSTGVVVRGYRLVFAPDAVAYEPVAASSGREFERKVRVITRGLQAVVLRRTLLNPLRHGFYALQLFSHKVLRRLVVFPLLFLAILSPLLWTRGLIYRLVTVAQAAFYSLALLHILLRKRRVAQAKILSLPFYFCMVNTACLLAALNLLRGRRIERWEPRRQNGHRNGHQSTTVTERGASSATTERSKT